MELKISSKKLGAPARVTAQKEKAAAPAGQSPLTVRNTGDRLSLSRQALSMLEQRNRELWDQAQKRQKGYEKQKSNEEAALDALGRSLRTMKLCNRIASRIRAGDRVPPEDLRYLMKNDPAGYRLAMAMRKPKKNPKEWESALEDEDRREVQTESLGEMMKISGGAE